MDLKHFAVSHHYNLTVPGESGILSSIVSFQVYRPDYHKANNLEYDFVIMNRYEPMVEIKAKSFEEAANKYVEYKYGSERVI